MVQLGSCAHSKCMAREYSDSNWVRYCEVQEVSFQSKYMLAMEERTLLEKDACRSRKKGLGSRQQDTILEFKTGDASAKLI